MSADVGMPIPHPSLLSAFGAGEPGSGLWDLTDLTRFSVRGSPMLWIRHRYFSPGWEEGSSTH